MLWELNINDGFGRNKVLGKVGFLACFGKFLNLWFLSIMHVIVSQGGACIHPQIPSNGMFFELSMVGNWSSPMPYVCGFLSYIAQNDQICVEPMLGYVFL